MPTLAPALTIPVVIFFSEACVATVAIVPFLYGGDRGMAGGVYLRTSDTLHLQCVCWLFVRISIHCRTNLHG